MNRTQLARKLKKLCESDIIEVIINLLALLAICIVYLLFKKQEVNVESLIDLTIFSGVVLAFITKIISGLIAKYIRVKIEDAAKLETDYEHLIKKYPKFEGFIVHDDVTFPVQEISLVNKRKIKIVDDRTKVYETPATVQDHYGELLQSHSESTMFNQLMIRVDSIDIDNDQIKLHTSRTTYYQSLVTNRAIDYMCADGFCVRDEFEYGPYLRRLEESELSNHLGFNGIIETSDGKIIFIKRGSKVTIGKNTLANGIGASLKAKYALNGDRSFDCDGLKKGIVGELEDELKLDPQDYGTIDLEKNIIALYRDIVEGGKPQLLIYVKLNATEEKVLKQFKSKIKKKRKENKQWMVTDGKKLLFWSLEDIRNATIRPSYIKKGMHKYRVVPSVSASVLMYLEYLDTIVDGEKN